MAKKQGKSSDNLLQRRVDVGGASSITEYLRLYESYLDRIIRWSEGDPESSEPFLRPQYLHLHESDIGGSSRYQMWRELATFVEHLNAIHHELQHIVFCHSWEEQNCFPPEECRREKFFYYELPKPKFPVDPKSFSVPGGSGKDSGSVGRMEPVDVDPHLRDLLRESHWFQTYMLRCSETGNFTYHNELLEATERNVDDALQFFADHSAGGYQFTVYGYKFRDPSRRLSDAERAFLRHVFVLHIITWNFKLRSAHEERERFAKHIREAREQWLEGRRHFDAVHAAVDKALSAIESVAEGSLSTDSHLVPVGEGLVAELFNKPHDLGEFVMNPKEHFATFLQHVNRLRLRFPRCHEFAISCGSDRYENLRLSLSEDEGTTWITGIWLAIRLLTRHLSGGEAADSVRLGLDQIVLAVCAGLTPPDWASPTLASLHVELVGRGFKDQSDFLTRCAISTGGICNWPISQWRISQSPTDEFVASWRRQDTTAQLAPLEDLVRAGILRTDDHADERFHVIVPRQSNDCPDACAELLGRLSRMTSLLAYPTEKKYIKLIETFLRYECAIDEETGRLSAVCEVELRCQGQFSQIEKLKEETDGTLNREWTQLLGCLNQKNRGFIYDGRKSAGLALRENRQDGTVSVFLTLESARKAWS